MSRNASCSGCSSSVVGRDALDGQDLVAVRLHRQHQAGARGAAVEQDGAGAADAVLAAEMRAGEAELVAQEIGERQAHLDLVLVALAVDRQRDLALLAHRLILQCCPRAVALGMRSCAFSSARRDSTAARCWR